jgi:hypothetical protein
LDSGLELWGAFLVAAPHQLNSIIYHALKEHGSVLLSAQCQGHIFQFDLNQGHLSVELVLLPEHKSGETLIDRLIKEYTT